MSWENRESWHIDHIVPISLAKDENEVKILSNYKNLRPMWSIDNIIKSNTIDVENPFYKEIIEYRSSLQNNV